MNNDDEQHVRRPGVVLTEYSESGVVQVVAMMVMVEVMVEVEVEEEVVMAEGVTVDAVDVVDVGEGVCTAI